MPVAVYERANSMCAAAPIRVLVVDDEERIRRFARLLLETDHSLTVVGEAENGRAAAALAHELAPDVVLMDISMPVMNGLEAARKILRDRPETSIIMTTAMGVEPYRAASLSVGASAFIDKSCLTAELIEIVHQAAEHGAH